MLLIGHPLLQNEKFYYITVLEQIKQSKPNATLFFDFDVPLSNYAQEQQLTFALHVKNIKELVLANALGASFFIVDKSLAINAQKVADDYLFDGKVMLLGIDENDIEFVALNAIDGIIFKDGIIAL